MARSLVLILAILALAGCARPDRVQTLSGFAQGTTWQVSVWRPGGVDVLGPNIEAELDRLDAVLSNYRPDSVIERFNADTATSPVAVGKEIVGLVEAARIVSASNHGCYDLTVKPLFDLWGFNGDTLTVLGDDPTAADAWSTALLCLGADDGLREADRAGVAALFITDNNGQLHERASAAWAALKDVEVH